MRKKEKRKDYREKSNRRVRQRKQQHQRQKDCKYETKGDRLFSLFITSFVRSIICRYLAMIVTFVVCSHFHFLQDEQRTSRFIRRFFVVFFATPVCSTSQSSYTVIATHTQSLINIHEQVHFSQSSCYRTFFLSVSLIPMFTKVSRRKK